MYHSFSFFNNALNMTLKILPQTFVERKTKIEGKNHQIVFERVTEP